MLVGVRSTTDHLATMDGKLDEQPPPTFNPQ